MWYHFENFGTNRKIFSALRASELSRVAPPDIFGMVPGTIMVVLVPKDLSSV